MARSKVKLEYIANDAVRKTTFKKRKRGLMKKMSEVTTLCGIEGCVIVSGPGQNGPEVWPSPNGAREVMAKYRDMPEMIQKQRRLNQESFLMQRLEKVTEQVKKMRKENEEKAMRVAMEESVGGTGMTMMMQGMRARDLKVMGWMIEERLRDIEKKMEATKEEVYVPEPPSDSRGFVASVSALNSDGHLGFGGDEILPPFEDIKDHSACFWLHQFMP